MSAERRFDLALLAAWAAADAKDDAERDRLFRDAEGHLDWGFMAALRVDRDTVDAAPVGRIARLRGLLDDARFDFSVRRPAVAEPTGEFDEVGRLRVGRVQAANVHLRVARRRGNGQGVDPL